MKKVKWGVIGVAAVARNLVIPGIQRAKNAEFFAIASRNIQKLTAYRDKGVKIYASYDELLKNPDIEAVYIPLPNNLHCEWTIKAAQHKKHILCEKPLAMNYAECVCMVNAAKANNVYLMEAFMYRHTAKTKLISKIVRDGVLGEIRHVHSIHGFDINDPNNVRLIKRTGGGALFDMGCYSINFFDMIMEIAGAKLTDAQASFVMRKDIYGEDVDVRSCANLVYDNGAMCSGLSWFDSQPFVLTRIVGKKGVLAIPHTFTDEPIPMTLSRYNFDADPACDGREIMMINPDYINHENMTADYSDRYCLEVEEFSRAIIEHSPPSFSDEASLRNMKVIEQLYESGKKYAERHHFGLRG